MQQILIRHGESLSNREGRVQGQADVELSEVGRRQAEAVAAWCRSQPEIAAA
ncbi:MAG: histidine phosphatase family protein, partial [Planctomycetia bacterium]|nr:histidine phosphatase family protein [Planctomycetia bacterium]